MKLNDLVHRVRAHPGIVDSEIGKLADDNFAFVVAQLVFPVLQDLAEEVGRSFGFKRHYTFSDPLTTTVTLDADGSADLTPLTAENGILLENLHFGEIRHPDSAFPLVPVGSTAELDLPGNYDGSFLHYALIGRRIRTRSKDSNATPLAGDLSFAVPRVNGLDDMDDQLQDDLTDAVIARLRGMATPPPNTGAT